MAAPVSLMRAGSQMMSCIWRRYEIDVAIESAVNRRLRLSGAVIESYVGRHATGEDFVEIGFAVLLRRLVVENSTASELATGTAAIRPESS